MTKSSSQAQYSLSSVAVIETDFFKVNDPLAYFYTEYKDFDEIQY